jgi:hypothetical protein
MESLTHALKSSLEQHNWYASVILALTLPDICGKIEFPDEYSGARYKKWCKKYLEPKYTRQIGPKRMGSIHTFLSGDDCYALRCALLHEGSDDITEQRARESLDRFHFTAPPKSGSMHCNQKGAVLQLQVDAFAQDIISSISEWLTDIEADTEKQQKIEKLVKIYESFAF